MIQPLFDRARDPLPSEKDFDPFCGDLDARCAWEHFGGLDLDDAYTKFSDHPERYFGDFMWMGRVAFHFYYPVVEQYLRDAEARDDWSSCEVAWLGSSIAFQFSSQGPSGSRYLRDRVQALCRFVEENAKRFASTPEEEQEIREQWAEVESNAGRKAAEPGATDNPDDAQRLREDH